MHVNKQSGFSIVEIALVLIIFGFVSSIVLLALRTYTEQARITKTRDAIENSSNIINSFNGENGVYPCPAPLNLAPNAPGYGVSMAGAAIAANSRIGRNDINGDGINEQYVYGAVPFNTIINDPVLSLSTTDDLSFSGKDSLDGWGNKIVYIVSRHLCDPAYAAATGITGNPEGVLDVVTEATCTSVNPADAPGTLVPQSVLPGDCNADNRRYAQFVVISHGETGRGAFNENGQRGENCFDVLQQLPAGDPGLGPQGVGDWFNNFASDRKNCKYDRPDVAGVRNGEFFYGLRSEGDDRTYYDDYIKFFYEDNYQIFGSATNLTQILPNGTTVDIPRMQNVNTGEIGIGLQDPQEVLHINGDLQAFDIEADEFCADIDNGVCMPVDVLTTTGIVCPNGEAMQSIELNSVNCTDPFAGLNFTCPLPNERLRLVSSDGTFECCDPTVLPVVCNSY